MRELPLEELERTTNSSASQGVAARIRAVSAPDVREVVHGAGGKHKAFLLCLDRIQDPHNLGALVRSANASGAQAVIVPDRHSPTLTGAVVKAAAGATLHTPIIRVANIARTLEDLRRAGIWTVGLDDNANQSIFAIDLTEPVALVVGSEGEGIRRLTREHCDLLARIPMRGAIASLNASVAGSVAMYEVVRQRMAADAERPEAT